MISFDQFRPFLRMKKAAGHKAFLLVTGAATRLNSLNTHLGVLLNTSDTYHGGARGSMTYEKRNTHGRTWRIGDFHVAGPAP
jgi:hypothetical protein